MARLTQQGLDEAFKQGGSSTAAYEAAKARQQQTAESQATHDAALKQLITGKQMDETSKVGMYDKQLQTAQDLRGQYGENVDVDAGDIRIGKNVDPIALLLAKQAGQQVKLTPAQQAAETAGGKKVSEYMTGGRASSQAAEDQMGDVKKELVAGKRDWYDKTVGGALQNHPGLMGAFAPSEKARADKVQQATIGALKAAGIQRPTQWEVQKIFGQNYDSTAPTELIISRIDAAAKKMAAMRTQAETEASNLGRTGYVTPGVGGNPMESTPQTSVEPSAGNTGQGSPTGSASGLTPEQRAARIQQLKAKMGQGG